MDGYNFYSDVICASDNYYGLSIDNLLGIIEQVHQDISCKVEDLRQAEPVFTCLDCGSEDTELFDDSIKIDSSGSIVAIEVSDINYHIKCNNCGNTLDEWRELDGTRMGREG